MSWIERRPHNVTEQLLEYAESGRLVEGPRPDDRSGAIALVVTSAATLGAGLSIAATGALGTGGQGLMLIAMMCTLGSLAILVPGIRLLRRAPTNPPVRIRPGALLPPDLVDVGNWIHRGGAWLRVDAIGKGGDGEVTALLSSGEVVTLTQPATIAGDDFRPTDDPIASLRR